VRENRQKRFDSIPFPSDPKAIWLEEIILKNLLDSGSPAPIGSDIEQAVDNHRQLFEIKELLLLARVGG
jgi:hypothetical protein